ncbi:hypothetical protein BHE74_00013137 [Ensete ventricosum]|nr:hypothetical protein BHE74_00013137 [Ensete ventricosum]
MFIKLSSHPKVEMVTPVRFLRTDRITFGIVELVLNIDILFLRFAVGVLEPTALDELQDAEGKQAEEKQGRSYDPFLLHRGIGRLSNLRTSSSFYDGKDREHYVIRELGNLRGEVRTLGLKHVVCVDDAKAANLVSKAHLEKLTREWFSSSIDYSKADCGDSSEEEATAQDQNTEGDPLKRKKRVGELQ